MQGIPASSSDEGHRFRLVNALNGEFYAIPEVGRNENWTVPWTAFPKVQTLRGNYLWKLEPVPGDQNQQLRPSRLKSGAYVFSEAPVHAVLDSCGKPCCHGLLMPDSAGCISCVFGIPGRPRSLSCNVTNARVTWRDHVTWTETKQSFTYALGPDLKEVFMQEGCHGLFVCEMESEPAQANIDMCFHQRITDVDRPRMASLDDSPSLREYLLSLLKLHGLIHLEVLSVPPYVYIGNPNILSVKSPEVMHPLPEDKDRRAVHCDIVFKPTGDKISVVCIQTPLHLQKEGYLCITSAFTKRRIFDNYMERAGGGISNASKTCTICGDVNTYKGSLTLWKQAYQSEENMITIPQARNDGNRDGDYMLSSSFVSEHVESTIDVSFNNRKHVSVSHVWLALHGIPIAAPELLTQ